MEDTPLGAFLDPLQVEFIDGRLWRVMSPFAYRLGSPDGAEMVIVPEGFLTDFASVPRGLWNWLPPTGPYGKAAVIHDYLYQFQIIVEPGVPDAYRLCERDEADRILREAMKVIGVNVFTRQIVYWGVRLGGGVAWKKYRDGESPTDGS